MLVFYLMCYNEVTKSMAQPPKVQPLYRNDLSHFNVSAQAGTLYPNSLSTLLLYCYYFCALFVQKSRFSSDDSYCMEIVFLFILKAVSVLPRYVSFLTSVISAVWHP